MQAFSVKRFSKVIIGASDESGRMTFIVSIRSVYIPRVSQNHIFFPKISFNQVNDFFTSACPS